MNAWPACPRRGNVRQPKNPAKGVLHHARGDPLISRRQKHVVIGDSQTAALFEIIGQSFRRRGVEGN
jgi:hypothetical protein